MIRLNNVGLNQWPNGNRPILGSVSFSYHRAAHLNACMISVKPSKSSKVKQKLESTGCFKAVKVTIDTSELYENHSPHGHQIIFDLDEKLLNLSTHTGSFPISRILIG